MVLLWGITTDRPLQSVRECLERLRARHVFLDQQAVLQSQIELTLDGEIKGTLQTPGWSIDLESVAATYLRPYDVRRVTAIQRERSDGPEFQRALCFEDALICWVEMTPTLVVNRPSAMSSNNSKPYQLQLIRRAGFAVPDTLVTTDPQAALDFWNRHGLVIYKSVSGIRSIVNMLGPEHLQRLQDVKSCPTQFQECIKGTDVRVHVVGDDIFCCEVLSNAVDYRYPSTQNEHALVRSCRVPPDIEVLCHKLTSSMNLCVAGIDLRRTASGDWYCFEVNPSPGFSFYEEATGQKIGEALAGLLMRDTRNVPALKPS